MKSHFTLLVVALVAFARAGLADDRVDFRETVAPLIEQHCVRCHSASINKGDVSLETITDLRDNDYLVAGDPDGSYLIELITSHDGDQPEMPKDGAPLSESEVALIRRWVMEGASWPDEVRVTERAKADESWWSLQPLAKRDPPSESGLKPSAIIDRFIRSRLAEQDLDTNPGADRRTLIRRATYDLIGLPPSPDEIETFVNDPDPGAYANLIDRLLASPHYGERWGRHWLDVVRFGESNGFERNVIINDLWPFRDYVIRSINADKPFDQFIREHIVGDVLGEGRPEIQIGAAFLVAGAYDNVGNQDPVAAAQIRANTIDEMIRATGDAFLGLTMGCARCHDHKFDPIRQSDYYGWYATFAGVVHGSDVWANGEQRATHAEKLKPLNQRKAELVRRQTELNESIKQRLTRGGIEWPKGPVDARRNEDTFPVVEAKFLRFSVLLTNQSQPCLDELEVFAAGDDTNLAASGNGAIATASSLLPGYAIHQVHHLNDGKYGNSHSWISNTPEGWAMIEFPSPKKIDRVVWGRDREGRFKDRLPIEYSIEVSMDGKSWREVAHGREREPVSDRQWVHRDHVASHLPIAKRWKRPPVDRRGTTENFPSVRAKFVRLICDGQDVKPQNKAGFRIDEFEVWSSGEQPTNVALASHGGKATGKAREIKDFPGAYGAHLVIDGKTGERFLAAGTDLTVELARPTEIDRVVFSSARGSARPDQPKFVFVGDYRIQVSLDGENWEEVANGKDRKPANDAHRNHRISQALQPSSEEASELKRIAKEIRELTREIDQVPPLRRAWLGTRKPAPGPFHVFLGGSPQRIGDQAFPASLSAVSIEGSDYRLESGVPEADRRAKLADWLTSPENPLVARVLANRIWQYHFGVGIVDTPNDLGYMGGRPTHPELLDFLAGSLIENGWRLKPMHRMIMNSEVYRQSSDHRKDAAMVDGDSRLLWRFPPRRLSAEEVRDTMLCVAGKLKVIPLSQPTTAAPDGGPGFRLYEYQQDNVATYVPLDQHGPETYRRAVYHQNARASVIDLMTEFDQPDCAYSAPRRSETTTPLQALTLLNHRFTLDMSAAFADRLERSSEGDVTTQIKRAYQICIGREATPDELLTSQDLVNRFGMTALCRVLLNTSEMIYVK